MYINNFSLKKFIVLGDQWILILLEDSHMYVLCNFRELQSINEEQRREAIQSREKLEK